MLAANHIFCSALKHTYSALFVVHRGQFVRSPSVLEMSHVQSAQLHQQQVSHQP